MNLYNNFVNVRFYNMVYYFCLQYTAKAVVFQTSDKIVSSSL